MTVSNITSASGEASVSSGARSQQNQNQTMVAATTKKKRNLPGMPDPEAEVIALSPKTLMATNRFVCEICNKGFQRDQNLQLHRRGHNLPWKLRQRTSKEVRKRVYICPEVSCVHHDPSRALGDLTGIKKHFCRKHGEKKFKCDKCSKRYAVQSDWKAHSKTCGTREYRCDCGTLFSRRDSFVSHRAFCDALAEESAKAQAVVAADSAVASGPANSSSDDDPKNKVASTPLSTSPPNVPAPSSQQESEGSAGFMQPSLTTPASCGPTSTNSSSMFASLFASAGGLQNAAFTDLIGAMTRPDPTPPPVSTTTTTPAIALALGPSSPSISALFSQKPSSLEPNPHLHYTSTTPAHMSATALLQKAAQMGATASSNSSFMRGLGLLPQTHQDQHHHQNQNHHHPQENWTHHTGLGLGLLPPEYGVLPREEGVVSMQELMSAPLFGPGGALGSGFKGEEMGCKPTTVDFLGLGSGASGPGGLSALITSIGRGLDMAAALGGVGGGAGASPGRPGWDGS
ncbi:protein indeterminate-domain 2 isoform X2 [Amborella trichopoda]|nr:protein indeterminate-domain 2 isoform X2 [Amborella trichopoda]|eukprot:XP_020530264.1 protein indeterminate-domain 2 isoform X2 [Amborella trichopoda]